MFVHGSKKPTLTAGEDALVYNKSGFMEQHNGYGKRNYAFMEKPIIIRPL